MNQKKIYQKKREENATLAFTEARKTTIYTPKSKEIKKQTIKKKKKKKTDRIQRMKLK